MIDVKSMNVSMGLDINTNPNRYILKSQYVESISKIIEQKIQEFKKIRDEREVAAIQTDKGLFDYDSKSRERISAAITALEVAGKNAKIGWTLADNSEAVMTVKDLKNIISTVAMRSNDLHMRYRQLKNKLDEIKAQTDNKKIKMDSAIEQIKKLDWDTEDL